MKSGLQILLVIPLILLAVAFSARAQFSLTSASSSNTYAVTYNSTSADTNVLKKYRPRRWDLESVKNDSGSNRPGNDSTNLIPLIQFEDVPITIALENLARQGHINYLVDLQLGYDQPDANGDIKIQPTFSCHLENITPFDGFIETCDRNDLVVVKDTRLHVLLVRARGHEVNFIPADIFSSDTNVIPLIKFVGMPLSRALQNLVKQGGIKCILSPRIDSGGWDSPEPVVTIQWENLTAAQALAAVCENYDLVITKYPVSGIIRIGPQDE